MKQPRFTVYVTLLAHILATACLVGCGPASALFDTIDQLVNPPPPGGTLDDSFGTGGIVAVSSAEDEEGYGVAVQQDGKIVVAGSSDSRFSVMRFSADGTLDTSFGTSGRVTTLIGSSCEARAVAIQSDGMILVAGIASTAGNYDFAVARYTSAGDLDTSFSVDNDGITTTPIGSGADYATSLAIQSDGKILVAGYYSNSGNFDFAVVRYTANGDPDPDFDIDGIVTTAFGSFVDAAKAIAVQGDGKIIVAGYADTGSQIDFAVARYNANGTYDTSFDADGKVTTPIAAYEYLDGLDLAIQDDSKIVIAGCSMNAGFDDIAVARYNSNGTLDTLFGTNGIVTTPIGLQDDFATAAAIQEDGMIVVAGYSTTGVDNQDFTVVRYTTTGQLDDTFGSSGIVVTPIKPKWDRCRAMALQSDGKIVLAGMSRDDVVGNGDFAVVRYLPGRTW